MPYIALGYFVPEVSPIPAILAVPCGISLGLGVALIMIERS